MKCWVEDTGVGKYASLRLVAEDGSWHPVEVWGVEPRYRFREKPNAPSTSYEAGSLTGLLRIYREWRKKGAS